MSIQGKAPQDHPTVDPLPGYLDEWRKVRAEFEGTPGDDEEADNALFQRMTGIAAQIIHAQPVTQEGAAAQLEILMADGMIEDLAAGQATEMLERVMASLRAGLAPGA